MHNIRPITKSPATSEKVVEQIQGLISSSDLGPGDELPTQEFMAERMGVSRASVREALKALEAKGFINQKQNGRYSVAVMTSPRLVDPLEKMVAKYPERIWEILEISRVLIAEAAKLAAQRASKDQVDTLGKLVSKLEIAKDDKGYFRKEFNGTYLDFYRTLVAATRNTVFVHLVYSFKEILWEAFPYPRVKLASVPRIPTIIYEQHRDIWKAVKAKDPQGASESVIKHFNYIESKLREIVDNPQS